MFKEKYEISKITFDLFSIHSKTYLDSFHKIAISRPDNTAVDQITRPYLWDLVQLWSDRRGILHDFYFRRVLIFVEVHVKQKEDEAIERGTKPVTQPPDPCDHALCYTWKSQKIVLLYWLINPL